MQAGKSSVAERKGKDSEGSLKKFAVEGGAVSLFTHDQLYVTFAGRISQWHPIHQLQPCHTYPLLSSTMLRIDDKHILKAVTLFQTVRLSYIYTPAAQGSTKFWHQTVVFFVVVMVVGLVSHAYAISSGL